MPFPPIAFVGVQRYGDTDLARGTPVSLEVDQTTVSQGALVPLLTSPRDVVVVGEWLSWSQFDSRSPMLEDFDVTSVAVPVGWFRQASPDWQVAAFAMPLGHKASLPGSDWSWETMGGVFGRRMYNQRVWWAVGLFVDAGPGDDLYLPYLGASWSINEAWTLSAVLPWPAVLWAPTGDLLFRLGASPSGTSWQFDTADAGVSVDLSTYDLGLSAERRIWRNVWANVELGVGGFRALTLRGSNWESPGGSADPAPYLSLSLNFRPALPTAN